MAGALLGLAAAGFGRGAAADAGEAAPRFPDVVLVDQDGRKLRFYDDLVKGKVVLVNFIFTSCRGPCPLETAKLRQVQELLGDRVGRDIFMYSISIDPETDTPAVLKAYAQKFKVRPGWKFLTGRDEDITLLRRRLGLYDEGVARNDHTVNLVVGNDATGQWLKRSSFDHPRVLAAVLGERLFNYAVPRAKARGYAQAPGLRFDAGEDLFRRRCQACHTVGGGDRVGPDLLGVTRRRERAWLERWIRAPDELIAAGDPLAKALAEQYKPVPMPNLGLGERDVAMLLRYLGDEDRRLLDGAKPADGARR